MSQFRKIYPPNGRLTFDGGLNNQFERSIIQDNESPDALNVEFSNGSVKTRGGTSKLNTTAVGSYVCDGIYTRRAQDNSETMVAWFNGTAFNLTGNSTFATIASAQSIYTAGNRVGSAQQENHIFFGNGGTLAYKWNGTNWTRHGIYAPTATATVASSSAGALTGDHSYKYTVVNSGLVESDVSPAATFTATATGGRLIVTLSTFSASFGVARRRLYRSDAGTYKRVTELADNTTTTYEDNVATASLGVTAPTDQGVPPLYNTVIYHQSRLFMNDTANPNLIWYTEIANPYVVKTTSFFRIGDNTSDLVKGLAVYDNSLVVFCEKSIWLIYMTSTDPTEWRVVRSRTDLGCRSPYGITYYENKVLFPAMQNGKFAGFAALSGDSVDPSATLLTVSVAGSNLKSDRIRPDMGLIQSSYVKNISSIIWKSTVWNAVTYSSNQTTNNRVYMYDYSISDLSRQQKEAWIPFAGFNPAQFTVYNDNLYFGDSTATGFVYQADTTSYNDTGVAINSYFWTKELGAAQSDYQLTKDFRYVNIMVDLAGDYNMGICYRVDSDIGNGNCVSKNLNPGGSLWGTMVWGTDTWGGGSAAQESRMYLGTTRGKRIQFKFSNLNTVNQRFKVHYLKFAYNIKGYR